MLSLLNHIFLFLPPQAAPNPFTSPAPSGDTRGSSVLQVAGSGSAGSDALALKEREIRAKERELEKRFEELQNRERALGGVKLKNWPKFYPIVCASRDGKRKAPRVLGRARGRNQQPRPSTLPLEQLGATWPGFLWTARSVVCDAPTVSLASERDLTPHPPGAPALPRSQHRH